MPDIFISYSNKDAEFVSRLREALVNQGIEEPWQDYRQIKGGDALEAEIFQAIEAAKYYLLIVSPNMFSSAWVAKEAHFAARIKERSKNHFRIIPLVLDDTDLNALKFIFPNEELAAIRIQSAPGGIREAMPDLRAALGLQLPNVPQPAEDVEPEPLEELFLELTDPRIEEKDGKRRAVANAKVTYHPSQSGMPPVTSRMRFMFNAPLGVIEAEDLKWYLEKYYIWPTGVFKQRAENVEKQLPEWGHELYKRALPEKPCANVMAAWDALPSDARRCFTVFVDAEPAYGSSEDQQKQAKEAATLLLSLPWELLHDGRDFLFQGRKAVRVRRQLPNHERRDIIAVDPPVRILMVSPRPEDKSAGYIDHRVSALPLVQALETLGDLAEITVLSPPTFPALKAALKNAQDAKKPFHVVHFDGHGVYQKHVGLGGLCFEDPNDAKKLEKRASQIIDADDIAAIIRDYRVPLVFLEACQSAQAELDPTASVATALLSRGVASVIAMTHSVLVETARRFVAAFYGALVSGKPVGEAMLTGQQALKTDTFRLKIFGAGKLHLEDWFVPVLYQEKDDPQLFKRIPSENIRKTDRTALKYRLGELPEPPEHEFIGRSRELLKLERLLEHETWAEVIGQGGEGKTTLAAELARWLVRSGRFCRTVFVSAETCLDARTMMDAAGRQLIPNYSVAQFADAELFGNAFLPIERALEDDDTLIILDNMETALAHDRLLQTFAPFIERLLKTGHTRIVFTSREPLPEPFDRQKHLVFLHRLDKDSAIDLVTRVMAGEGLELPEDDQCLTTPEIESLVETVNCHARSLVLLAPHIHKLGVEQTQIKLARIMTEIDQKFPNEREKSLFACVELSLQRLSGGTREKIAVLGVFHGGADMDVLAMMLEVEKTAIQSIAVELVTTGLAQIMPYDHLRLHPALCPYLNRQLNETQRAQFQAQWAEGMKQLAGFLYKQRSQNTHLSTTLTLLELPNLLALLAYLQKQGNPEETVRAAMKIEGVLQYLGRPHILKTVSDIREQESKKLGGWNHTRFMAAQNRIERLLESGNLQQAFEEAQALKDKALQAGEQAYPVADYDIAVAFFLLGRVLSRGGASEHAIQPILEARKRFQVIADGGNKSAEGMVSACFTEQGDCFRNIGRLDDSAAAYEKAIEMDEKRGASRDIAVNKGQLGTVRLLQKRYSEALEAYESAREIFENFGEARSVAVAWHQIGMVHEEAGHFDPAEQAHRKSLAIRVQQKDLAGEASSLDQLGILYQKFGRLEEAVVFHRQAADKRVELGDMAAEGRSRNNIANTLIKLNRFDEARREILRAIECFKPYGHAATPWKAWDILHDLEQAVGNAAAAAQAREKAMALFLAYRRDGGENYSDVGRLCFAFAQAVQAGQMDDMREHLKQYTHPTWKPLVSALQAMLSGSRDPALGDDPGLDYDDAAEVKLLLERLG